MAPQNSEIKNVVNSTNSKVHSLKAAIFHTMAYKMSLEINNGTVTLPTRRSFLKSLYNVCRIKKNTLIMNNTIAFMLGARKLLFAKQPRKLS